MTTERTVATLLADYLRQAGVTHVFGYPGESVVDFMEAARCEGPATVRAMAPAGTVVTADVGSHKIMAGQAWTSLAPRETLITNGLSAMGFGLPAAIAAGLSLPGVPAVSMIGDGGFAMTATELSVAARYGLPLVVVVFADGSLNRIELRQQQLGYPLTATSVDRTDIPALAESLGCDGVRVESVAGLEKALSPAFAARTRPLVIEARIGPSQYSAQF
jgi:acetolactate synthase-1/2/3 large subunit